ncbi:hypothetical protein [Bifidobacterium scardovii]|uniref:Uncharacterized protein n=1 Tax=Bifidobacterium scardovii TaxID=158787 RepID=A0A087DGN8_9BIFI|nr:hypothetical protein [Bifidobacterium scardovii]KFI94688.1 hypothetical protein BSCA_0740 [Bifidobacterium scardovii]MDK6349826.1 hypothetical protein [Bifidobacterium scardovii]MDU8982530.1 hypothetical protein [Bifidobacterium scardovii]DAE55503.1 MAG TPA: hypothetical protein [Caudoviricetes sp.]
MKTIRELTENARREASRQGFRLLKPAGIYHGELIIYAVPSSCEPGAAIGLPQGFFVDLESGQARYCTAKESMMLSSREFLEELNPIPAS